MLQVIYNALWYPALPVALWASGARGVAERRERLGHPAEAARMGADGARRVWVHAASVGEIEAVRPVVAALAARLPDTRLLVTTMTRMGLEAARRRLAAAHAFALAPLDSARAVGAFLDAVRPVLVLIAETELWPNYFLMSRRAGGRVAIVNGRLSERSLGRYRLARGLFRRTLEAADLILAQTEEDARRFIALGAPPARVSVTGNTKFDFASAGAQAGLRPELADFARGRALLVAGSTAPGEDQIILTAYRALLNRFPDLALVLAPRHPERSLEIERVLERAGLGFARASALGPSYSRSAERVLLLDTIGELRALYRQATVAFIGGSLVEGRGGQSPVEAALAGVPVLVGPFHENQRAVVSSLVSAQGAVVVADAAEIERACVKWLSDDRAREAAGTAARRMIEGLAGATERALMRLVALANLPQAHGR